jgi:large subunit ribosomal protein L9
VKKVANGYGRNYLIPQGLAMLATPSALAQAERIQEEADKRREIINNEMSGVAEKLVDMKLMFAAKAGETGKLYGSVTTQMIAEKLTEQLGTEINKRQIDSQPLRLLGLHTVKARLTIDLIPEFEVVVYREGESPENYMIEAEELAEISDEDAGYEEVIEEELVVEEEIPAVDEEESEETEE